MPKALASAMTTTCRSVKPASPFPLASWFHGGGGASAREAMAEEEARAEPVMRNRGTRE